MARRGWLSRIGDALQAAVRPIERLFEGEPRRAAPRKEPPSRPTPPPRGAPPRQPGRRTEPPRRYPKRRQHDPWADPWRKGVGRRYKTKEGRRPSYQDNADFVKDMAYAYNISVDQQEQFWKDYIKYMVKSKGSPYRLHDLRNPFFQNWNIDPDDFDWWEWREAMGYPHGERGH